jgi:hypothetical protein
MLTSETHIEDENVEMPCRWWRACPYYQGLNCIDGACPEDNREALEDHDDE